MSLIKVGVIGNGFVGKATQILGKCSKMIIYDIDPQKCIPLGTTLNDICQCQLIFVCVPTPFNVDSHKCDTRIVESVVASIVQECNTSVLSIPGIVVRSTVPPGTCDRLGVCHMPEYLTEANWPTDFVNTKVWEIGLPSKPIFGIDIVLFISILLSDCKKEGIIVSSEYFVKHSSVTETAKYMRNAILAVRVGVCNEFESFCKTQDIDYESVRQLVILDPRIGPAHTKVPGPDGKKGFGGTCLPKDLKAIIREMMVSGSTPMILMACSNRNDLLDRPNYEWMGDVGRAISHN
jgi:UDPglucose 6-dehydrogenase